MRIEDKENASPQLAPTPEATKIPSKRGGSGPSQNAKPSPMGSGAKNRFGFTPSPPGGQSKAAAMKVSSPVAASAKELIKELAGAESSGNDDSFADAKSSKELLMQLQNQSIPSSPAQDLQTRAAPAAFTLNFSPVGHKKMAKKPVLAERKPAEKNPAPVKAAPPKVPARRSMEKVPAKPAAPKSKGAMAPVRSKVASRDAASSVVEKKAVGVRAGVGKVR
jgi:hypothetical protein